MNTCLLLTHSSTTGSLRRFKKALFKDSLMCACKPSVVTEGLILLCIFKLFLYLCYSHLHSSFILFSLSWMFLNFMQLLKTVSFFYCSLLRVFFLFSKFFVLLSFLWLNTLFIHFLYNVTVFWDCEVTSMCFFNLFILWLTWFSWHFTSSLLKMLRLKWELLWWLTWHCFSLNFT